jgi:hypothetical protein
MQTYNLIDTQFGDITMVFIKKYPPSFFNAVINYLLTVIELGDNVTSISSIANTSIITKELNYTRIDYIINNVNNKKVILVINYELITESHPANKWIYENIFLGKYTILQVTLQINALIINRFGYIEKLYFSNRSQIEPYLYGIREEVMFTGRYF